MVDPDTIRAKRITTGLRVIRAELATYFSELDHVAAGCLHNPARLVGMT